MGRKQTLWVPLWGTWGSWAWAEQSLVPGQSVSLVWDPGGPSASEQGSPVLLPREGWGRATVAKSL